MVMEYMTKKREWIFQKKKPKVFVRLNVGKKMVKI